MEATKTIYKSEGTLGFMRGFTPSIVKCFTTSGTFFSTLYFFEENIKRLQLLSESKVHFSASVMARITQSVISNPIIIIQTRFQVVGFNEYNSIFDAAKKIYLYEGKIAKNKIITIPIIRGVCCFVIRTSRARRLKTVDQRDL